MALATAIAFRSLAAQMRKTETKIFITDFTASNPELMTQALGALFINNTKHQNITDALNVQCNKTISTIIQSRDSNDADVEAAKFESLPRRLIGHCASFLDQKSYGTVSRCNRAVYLGCNTPSKLAELSVGYILPHNNLPVDLSRFPFATNLKIIEKYNRNVDGYFFDASDDSIAVERIIASQIANMTRLQSLDVSQVNWSTRFLGIITNHQETIQRTKYLSVECKREEDNEQFIANIAAFKHLEFLKVNINYRSIIEWDMNAMIKMCSNLKGLDFNVNRRGTRHGIEVPILRHIGHRLHYLKLNRAKSVKDIKFANLKQFKEGRNCGDNVLGDVLRTAVNLEKVSMKGDAFNANLIGELLTKYKRLKYLEIDTNDAQDVLPVLDAVEYALSEKEKIQRNTLKIRMNTSFSSRVEHKEYFVKLGRIIPLLLGSNLDHCMLVLYLRRYELQMDSLYNDLRRTLKDNNFNIVVQQDGNNCIATINNPGCAICGWRERWLMNL